MAKSTFSGPVKSLAGFISAGNAVVVSLTADTSLTVAAHAGKILTCNDADGKFTLPMSRHFIPGICIVILVEVLSKSGALV